MAYNQEIADSIVAQLETTPLKYICEREGMPSRSEVYRWMDEHPEFGTQCARARVRQVDSLVDDMAEVENQVLSGELKPDQARVVLESQRWRAIKVAPQKYGDKTSVDHTGTVRVEQVEWNVIEAQPQLS